MLENKRLSTSPRIGKRKLEAGESNKEKASSSKKSKSAFGTKAHEEKKDTEETGKDGSEMDMDDSEGEDNWKDEDVGAEDEESENESDNDSPIHSASPGNDNSEPMVDVEDKGNEEKDVNSKREKNKEPKKDTTKDNLSEDKESVIVAVIAITRSAAITLDSGYRVE
ncbi:DNA polymerase II subunit B4-like [Cryptomeria japonica]|uniref:DNA polymerase II subunit B4-like n=1 Tax=Cryptomeria japonica TaxID=3369 RepID=UPI0027DA2AC4|nr:DNA polymerase II subunit B4-like [Cryptomeria japonica]